MWYIRFSEEYSENAIKYAVNGSKEIPSVYGQTQEQYEQMYELIQGYVKKLANKLNEEAKNKCQMYT